MTVFTITRPRQATATCERAPYVSWVFGAELKSALPFFFFVPRVITASDCVHNYMTKTGDNCMWTCSVCLVGIWCRIKTGASFFSSFFLYHQFLFPIDNFFSFSLWKVSFTAVEMCIFRDNSHAWSGSMLTATTNNSLFVHHHNKQ